MGKPAKFDRKVRLFEHPVLERLTRIHPIVPVLVWGPSSLGLIYLGLREGLRPAGSAATVVAVHAPGL